MRRCIVSVPLSAGHKVSTQESRSVLIRIQSLDLPTLSLFVDMTLRNPFEYLLFCYSGFFSEMHISFVIFQKGSPGVHDDKGLYLYDGA